MVGGALTTRHLTGQGHGTPGRQGDKVSLVLFVPGTQNTGQTTDKTGLLLTLKGYFVNHRFALRLSYGVALHGYAGQYIVKIVKL